MTGTVYRVEHKVDGNGCYKGRGGYSNELDAMFRIHEANMKTYPNPSNDNGINRSAKNDEFCGFESMDSLCNWFTDDEIEILEENDFEIIQLDNVEITVIGDKQVLFRKK